MSIDVRKMSTVADPDENSIELVQTMNVVLSMPNRSKSSFTVQDIIASGTLAPCHFAIEAIGCRIDQTGPIICEQLAYFENGLECDQQTILG